MLRTAGMVYMATTVPCATTLCVVNIGATEAKVECVLSSFLQLREDPGACMEDEVRSRGARGRAYHM